jgi:hypothetical protein
MSNGAVSQGPGAAGQEQRQGPPRGHVRGQAQRPRAKRNPELEAPRGEGQCEMPMSRSRRREDRGFQGGRPSWLIAAASTAGRERGAGPAQGSGGSMPCSSKQLANQARQLVHFRPPPPPAVLAPGPLQFQGVAGATVPRRRGRRGNAVFRAGLQAPEVHQAPISVTTGGSLSLLPPKKM